ncbi:hypothetical protein AOLI_G00123740 [Acnodon oligacanthus]
MKSEHSAAPLPHYRCSDALREEDTDPLHTQPRHEEDTRQLRGIWSPNRFPRAYKDAFHHSDEQDDLRARERVRQTARYCPYAPTGRSESSIWSGN